MRVLTLVCSLFLVGCASTTAPVATTAAAPVAPGVVSAHGRLQADHGHVVGADGKPVALAGVSYGWSQWEAKRFFNAGVVNWLKQDWHADIIRAPLGIHEEDGYFQNPTVNFNRVIAAIDAAIAADVYVIVDWHDHNAHLHTARAIGFFQEIAKRYGNRPNLIYEIYNEPKTGYTWKIDVKPYAEQVIAAIRAIDPDNLIVVGTPNWSQDVEVAADDPIKDPNVAYTLHFYAGTHKQKLRDKAAHAIKLGATLFVTEWGTCEASGDGPIDKESVEAWMTFLREHQISHCNWAIYDKHETAAIVRKTASSTGGWAEADLTTSGQYVRELVRNWSAGGK